MTTFKRVDAASPDVINASLQDAENKLTAAEARVSALEAVTTTQGDMIYHDGTNNARLAKDTNATRSLTNTGTNNNPAWAQVALATGVSGTLPRANGGWGAALLTGSATWAPGIIVAGANVVTTVTVTGVASGDLIFASHDNITAEEMSLSASYWTTDTVRVRMHNWDSTNRNIGSGTVRVWVVPKF